MFETQVLFLIMVDSSWFIAGGFLTNHQPLISNHSERRLLTGFASAALMLW
jgi:hypothetical protein